MDPLEQVLVHHDTTFAPDAGGAGARPPAPQLRAGGAVPRRGPGARPGARGRGLRPAGAPLPRRWPSGRSPWGCSTCSGCGRTRRWTWRSCTRRSWWRPPGGAGRSTSTRRPGCATANEKLWALHFPELTPETLVSRDLAQLRAFVEDAPDGAIVKPVDGHGGEGVVLLRRGDRNTPSVLELLTARGRDWVVAQAYVPAARQGDKRILLLDGEPLGAIHRVPLETENRANMAVGGQPVKTELTAARPGHLRWPRPAPPEGGAGVRGHRRHRRLPHRGERHQPHRARRAGADRRGRPRGAHPRPRRAAGG